MREQYWMAGDCPNCGEKDVMWAYKGARMGSSEWGHNYTCCSDKCGREFLNSAKHKALERQRIKDEMEDLQHQLKVL